MKKNILDSFLFHLSANKRLTCELVVVGVAILALFLFIHILLPIDKTNHNPILFTIEEGQGSYQIASNLEHAGLIRSRSIFTLYAFFTGRAPKLQSGDYLLAPSLDASAILDKFVQGDIINEKVTIKEGWDLFDIAAEFEKRGSFTQAELFAITGYPGTNYDTRPDLARPKDFSNEFAFLHDKPLNVSLEGYLFPDTYQITANETPESLVRRMLRNFETHLTPDIFGKIRIQEKTIFEVVNFASLLEKEIRTLTDKKIVAGILQKRMENGMRLQADATVVYIRDGNYYKVSIEETQVESPYNTYRVYGLPLGPISNPGLESIQAALEPEESPYWFYLSARDGTTIFTRNFEEHKAAKVQYLK